MEDCIFCKIIAGEIPSSKIYEDNDVVAFLNIKPVTKGHALVIPKKHSADFLEVDDETLAKTITKVKKVALGILDATKAAGFNLNVNTKPAAGQEVFHLHFHIIPRYSKDELNSWQGQDALPNTNQELAEKIKSKIE